MFKFLSFNLILLLAISNIISCGKVSEGEKTKEDNSNSGKTRLPHSAILEVTNPCTNGSCEVIEINENNVEIELEKVRQALINSGNKKNKSYPFLTVSSVLIKSKTTKPNLVFPTVCLMKNQMIRTLESFDHEIATDIIRYSIKQRVVTADLLSSDPNCSVLNQYIKASVGYEYTDNYELNLNDVFPRNPPLTHTLTGEQNRFVNKDEAFVFNKIVIKGKEFLQIKTVGTVEGEFCFFNASTGNFCEVFKNVKTKEDLWLSYGADNLTPQIFYFAKEAMIKDKLINFSILKKMDIQ